VELIVVAMDSFPCVCDRSQCPVGGSDDIVPRNFSRKMASQPMMLSDLSFFSREKFAIDPK